MAISKERKDELLAQYVDWANRSQALFVTQYTGLTMKDVDALRAKMREAGGEFHVVKNTLVTMALKQAGMELPEEYFTGSTAICFAFTDVPGVAKVLTDIAKGSEFVNVKGGALDKQNISASAVKALADLPPLPVMRAQLLGVISAPASKLVRTLAEPARSLAAVLQAKIDAAQPAA
ncbi:MAG: 50S ribosomal protein L10 [Chloroflexota bacterium]